MIKFRIGNKNKDLLWFGVLLVVGIIYRLAFLAEPARCDEVYNLLHYAVRPVSEIRVDYSHPNNHILHTLLTHISYSLFGLSYFGMRAPALIAGVAALPMIAWWAWLMTGERHTALLTLAFSAFAWPMLYFSVNGRGYALQTILAIALHLTVFSKTLERKPLVQMGLISALSAGLLYVAPSGVVVVIPLFTWAVIIGLCRRSFKFLAGTCVCAVATILLVVILYGPILKPIMAIAESNRFSAPGPVFTEAMAMLCDGIIHPVIFFPLIAAGLVALIKRNELAKGLYFALILFFYPCLTLIGKWVPIPAMFARSYVPLFPVAYLLAALGSWQIISFIRQKTPRRTIATAALIILGVNMVWDISTVIQDRSRLYFPERSHMASGKILIERRAKSLQRGETLAGTGINEDVAAAYYVTRERGFSGFYSLYSLENRKIRSVYLLAPSDEQALAAWIDLGPNKWSKPKAVDQHGPEALFVVNRTRPI